MPGPYERKDMDTPQLITSNHTNKFLELESVRGGNVKIYLKYAHGNRST